MCVGGLASGINVDELVDQLMEAERIPLNKMYQDQQLLEWQRDHLRDINRALLELDEAVFQMRLSSTYNVKSTSSSNESAVTAEAHSTAQEGAYQISVQQLATSTMLVSGSISEDVVNGTIDESFYGEHIFYTYDADGNERKHSITIDEDDKITDIVKKINDTDSDFRAFFDSNQNKLILEAKRTGSYAPEGQDEIFFAPADSSETSRLFTELLNLTGKDSIIQNGQNAKFTYNNVLEIESKDNSYELNGIQFHFHDVTDKSAQIVVQNDTEKAFENIMNFIDKYNEVVELLNKSQTEERHRDYPPLTEEQKEEMTESQIEKWEEKAKSGLLRGDRSISNTLYSMRSNMYASVDTGGAFRNLTQIGLETSKDYLDGGKIVLKNGSEDELKRALETDLDSVMKLFTNSDDGLMHRLDETVKNARSQITNRAGRQSTTSLEGYSLGRQMKDLNKRIEAFEARLIKIEDRYWSQFTAMEKAIQRLNDQSVFLMEQFGGMQ